MASIKVTDLSFYYDGSYDMIFEQVNFEIDTKWKLGFCGRNGRGKTTFLRLLMGDFEFRGHVASDVSFDYFPFEIPDKSRTVLKILLDVAPASQEWQIRKELSLLHVASDAIDRSFHTLSSGEQTKVLLAGLFLKGNHFLLIDEPTNHLDTFARRVVANYLKGKNGFILVSHDRTLLDACTDHTLSINKTNIEIISGNFSTWWQQHARQEAFEQQENEKLNEEIKNLTHVARQNKFWAQTLVGQNYDYAGHYRSPGSREARLRKDAKRKERQILENIEEKKMLLKNVETKEALTISPLETGEQLLNMENIHFKYDTRNILKDFSLTLNQGDRVAIVGANGSGKSSVLKLICGELTPCLGTIQLAQNLIISYVPQDATFLTGNLNDFALNSGLDLEIFTTLLMKLDFSDDQLRKDMNLFSAGQKKKVLIAKSLAEKAHLYIWDEPLNYIDVLSRMQIEELLLSCRPTMIFVEHDEAFIENVANQVILL